MRFLLNVEVVFCFAGVAVAGCGHAKLRWQAPFAGVRVRVSPIRNLSAPSTLSAKLRASPGVVPDATSIAPRKHKQPARPEMPPKLQAGPIGAWMRLRSDSAT